MATKNSAISSQSDREIINHDPVGSLYIFWVDKVCKSSQCSNGVLDQANETNLLYISTCWSIIIDIIIDLSCYPTLLPSEIVVILVALV